MGKYLAKYRNYEEYLNARGGNRKYPNVSLILDINKVIYGKNMDFPARLYTKPEIERYLLDDVLPVVKYTYRFNFDCEKIKDIYLDNNNFVIDEYMSEYNNKPTYRMDFDKIEKLQNEYPIYINDSLLFIELSSFYTTTLPIKEFNNVLAAPSPYFHEGNYMVDCYGYIKDGKIILFEELLDYEKLDKSYIYTDENEITDFYYLPDTTWQDVVYCEDNRQDYLNYLAFTSWRWMVSDPTEYPYLDNYVHIQLDEENDLILYYKDTNNPVLITDKLQETDYIIKLNNKKLITFYIDDTEYQAEEGMTWEEWLTSEYSLFEKFSYTTGFAEVYIDGKLFAITRLNGKLEHPVSLGAIINSEINYILVQVS